MAPLHERIRRFCDVCCSSICPDIDTTADTVFGNQQAYENPATRATGEKGCGRIGSLFSCFIRLRLLVNRECIARSRQVPVRSWSGFDFLTGPQQALPCRSCGKSRIITHFPVNWLSPIRRQAMNASPPHYFIYFPVLIALLRSEIGHSIRSAQEARGTGIFNHKADHAEQALHASDRASQPKVGIVHKLNQFYSTTKKLDKFSQSALMVSSAQSRSKAGV